MDILIKALQLIMSLSILIVFHEFGHFFAAKIFKTRVEKFYLFFNPWFSLFKIKKGETEYGIGWLPFGGYVKISGMIDESMDKEQLKQPPQPHEFRSKPAWQRLIIILGGVLVNVIFAIVIYIVMLAAWGEEYLPAKNMKYGIACDSLALEMGLRNGDKVLSVENVEIDNYMNIPAEILLEEASTVQVIRDGKKMDITIPYGFTYKLKDHKTPDFILPRFPFEVGDIAKDSPAKKGGMLVGDKIIGVNDKSITYYDEFRPEILKFAGKTTTIDVLRAKDTVHLSIAVSAEGTIGVQAKDPLSYFELKKKNYTILEAIPAGAVKAYSMIAKYIRSLRLLFSSETKGYESLGGFISIGKIFPAEWDWAAFWSLTAFISIILAIMNVLPIPALDGGYVLFILFEIITRRKPGEKFMEYAQYAGMILLIGLLLLANGNDIVKLF